MQYVQTREDYVRLRFKTNEADGLLLFADGNQGDYIILEMIRGRLYLNLDLGQLLTFSRGVGPWVDRGTFSPTFWSGADPLYFISTFSAVDIFARGIHWMIGAIFVKFSELILAKII